MVGIYKITNPKGKVYIGQSVNIRKRRNSYKNGECKAQTILYRSIKKYGWDKHKFEVVTECDDSDLDRLEIYYIDLYRCVGRDGMNCRLGGSRGRWPEEAKKRFSENRKAMGFKLTPEQIDVIKIRAKKNWPNSTLKDYWKDKPRNPISDQNRHLINQGLKKRMETMTLEERTKNNRRKGIKLTEEEKLNLSVKQAAFYASLTPQQKKEKMKCMNTPEARVKSIQKTLTSKLNNKDSFIKNTIAQKILLDSNTGIYYPCITDAAIAKGIPASTLADNLRNKRPHTRGLVYA